MGGKGDIEGDEDEVPKDAFVAKEEEKDEEEDEDEDPDSELSEEEYEKEN